MKTIGMIGLGKMGYHVAFHILECGYPMVLYDIRPESCVGLIKKGASVADSPEEVASISDITVIMVNTFSQCRACMERIIRGISGKIVIVCSTIAMDEMEYLGRLAKEAGGRILDAPVSGGVAGAKAGDLTVMAAGADDVMKICRPVLECFGKKIIHAGRRAGQGQAVKAVNQLLVGIHMCAAAEAFTVAKQCGLDLNLVYDAITSSAGTSQIFENRGKYLIARDFSTRSTLDIQVKDTDIACKTAESAGAPAFLGEMCREFFKLAAGKYPGTDDSIEVVRLYEELCGKGR